MSTGVIFILGKGVPPDFGFRGQINLAPGVIRAWVFTALHQKKASLETLFQEGSADATAITEANRRLGEILPRLDDAELRLLELMEIE